MLKNLEDFILKIVIKFMPRFNVPFEGMSVREVIKQPSFYLISAYLNLTIIPIDIFSVNYKVNENLIKINLVMS